MPPLPRDAAAVDATTRMESNPMQGEWMALSSADDFGMDAYRVAPKGDAAAPTIIVLHEIFGGKREPHAQRCAQPGARRFRGSDA
ncbi:MAG: hypothetical protein WDN69_32615 [Aliidongia sp.]